MTGRVYRFLHRFPRDRFREPVPIGSIGSEFSIFLRFIGSRPVSVLPVPGFPTFRWEPGPSEGKARRLYRPDHVIQRALPGARRRQLWLASFWLMRVCASDADGGLHTITSSDAMQDRSSR